MSLEDWLKNGWLKTHQTSQSDIKKLLNIIERDLEDCQFDSVSEDWRFAMAYNAARQCCTVALFCRGYRVSRGQSEHFRVIASLTLSMGESFKETRDYLQVCRNKRNISDYDAAGSISGAEVRELIETTQSLYQELKVWLSEKFPEYLYAG